MCCTALLYSSCSTSASLHGRPTQPWPGAAQSASMPAADARLCAQRTSTCSWCRGTLCACGTVPGVCPGCTLHALCPPAPGARTWACSVLACLRPREVPHIGWAWLLAHQAPLLAHVHSVWGDAWKCSTSSLAGHRHRQLVLALDSKPCRPSLCRLCHAARKVSQQPIPLLLDAPWSIHWWKAITW